MSGRDVDMIEELQLRRWARLNHQRLTAWDDSLHPIILEELRVIQHEHAVVESVDSLAATSVPDGYVPAASTTGRRIDEEHGGIPVSNPDIALESPFRNTQYIVRG